MNNFSSATVGCWENVGFIYDEVKEDLKVQKLLPGIFTSSKTSGNMKSVEIKSIGGYTVGDMIFHPIEMKLFAHDPSIAEMVAEGLTLSSWNMICSITKTMVYAG